MFPFVSPVPVSEGKLPPKGRDKRLVDARKVTIPPPLNKLQIFILFARYG